MPSSAHTTLGHLTNRAGTAKRTPIKAAPAHLDCRAWGHPDIPTSEGLNTAPRAST